MALGLLLKTSSADLPFPIFFNRFDRACVLVVSAGIARSACFRGFAVEFYAGGIGSLREVISCSEMKDAALNRLGGCIGKRTKVARGFVDMLNLG
jgi:hypothetical protein